ncbi:MAG: hypothetical protein QW279_09305 [Candidatus Jordarchaeaceae archaeon]
MKKVLLVVGIVLIILSLPLVTAPLYMKQSNPIYLGLALTPMQLPLSRSGQGKLAYPYDVEIISGAVLPENSTVHIEIIVTGGLAGLLIENSSGNRLAGYGINPDNKFVLDFHVPKEDKYYITLMPSLSEVTYSFRVEYTEILPVNIFWLTVYLTFQETPGTANYLRNIGILLLIIGAAIATIILIKLERETLQELSIPPGW